MKIQYVLSLFIVMMLGCSAEPSSAWTPPPVDTQADIHNQPSSPPHHVHLMSDGGDVGDAATRATGGAGGEGGAAAGSGGYGGVWDGGNPAPPPADIPCKLTNPTHPSDLNSTYHCWWPLTTIEWYNDSYIGPETPPFNCAIGLNPPVACMPFDLCMVWSQGDFKGGGVCLP